MRVALTIAATGFLALGAGPLSGAARVPAWVEQAQAARFPDLPPRTAALVLHHEKVVEVRPDGRFLARVCYAAQILTRDGRDAAAIDLPYLQRSERVESANAWLIRPSGPVRAYSRREFLDRADTDADLYSESRRFVLSAAAEAEPGSVFACEVAFSEQSIFSQEVWPFQAPYPTVRSRYAVRLPRGWRVEGRMFNHPGIAPQSSGAETSWELRHVPALAAEPMGPPLPAIAPVLALGFFPPDAAAGRVRRRPFASWRDVSVFLAELGDPQAVVDATIATRAAELVQGSDDEWGRIQAIARFVQRVNYVSVQMRLGLGGGMTPHPAPQVLRANYGDCKDKVALMRALLAAIGIGSFAVGVAYQDQPIIWEEWPSPQQFNHAIIAVRVSEAVEAPTVVAHPELGRLLFFDPTDAVTMPGDLPEDYQGSRALVAAGAQGGLVTLPRLPAEARRVERTIHATLTADGALTAAVREHSLGQAGAEERRLWRRHAASDYAKVITQWIGEGVPAASVGAVRPQDGPADGGFTLAVEFTAPRYAQSMRGNLLVFKPVLLARRAFTRLTAPERTHPVVLRARCFAETVEIALPAGFRAGEPLSEVELNEAFGRYHAKLHLADGRLRLTRSLVLEATTVPVADYARVRQFFEAIVRAEHTPVVLERERN